MTSISYLILAHHQPRHLARLVEALQLSEQRDSVFLHVDARVGLHELLRFVTPSDRLRLSRERFSGSWGGFSLVEATLSLVKQSRDEHPGADYVALISGDSYPLLKPTRLRSVVAHNTTGNLMSALPMPAPEVDKGLDRLRGYNIEGRLRAFPLAQLSRTLRRLPLRPWRRAFDGLSPYGGSQWWLLSGPVLDRVLERVKQRPRFVRFSRHAIIPDEFFFQTIVASLEGVLLEPSPMFASWENADPPPALLTVDNILDLRRSECRGHSPYGEHRFLFARKFSDSSKEVLDAVEDLLW